MTSQGFFRQPARMSFASETERKELTRQSQTHSRLSIPKFRVKTLYVDPSPIEINKGAFRLRPHSQHYTWHTLKC